MESSCKDCFEVHHFMHHSWFSGFFSVCGIFFSRKSFLKNSLFDFQKSGVSVKNIRTSMDHLYWCGHVGCENVGCCIGPLRTPPTSFPIAPGWGLALAGASQRCSTAKGGEWRRSCWEGGATPRKLTWHWKTQPFEDVSPIESRDFPLSC